MIKELIATTLLSACVGANNLKPREALNNGLLGGYCLRVRDTYDEMPRRSYSWTTNGNEMQAYFYYNGDYTWATISEFTLYEDTDDNIVIEFITQNNVFTRRTFSDDYSFDDINIYTKNTLLYFNSYVYFGSDMYQYFDYFFSSEPNGVINSYTGWYSLNRTFALNNTVEFYGSFSLDNRLFNHFIALSSGDGYANTVTSNAIYSDYQLKNHNHYK